METSLQLTCIVLVPSDSTTVTIDWYWSNNISECGRNITEELGRFDIYTSRGFYLTDIDRITTDLTIESPETDTGYYWCQVNDSSYNGVFISSNKAPVFDTGTMTICSGGQYIIQSKCVIGSTPSLISIKSTTITIVSTSTYVETITVSPTSNGVATSISPHITTITSIPINDISNTTVPSSLTSSITTSMAIVVPSVPSDIISNTPILSGVTGNTPVPSDQTSNNTTTVAVVVVTVIILLATLVLVIAAVIIIIIIVVKRQPHHSKSLSII